jgi:hypothetical protein
MSDETEAQRIARQDHEAANTYRRNRAIRSRSSRARDEQDDWKFRQRTKQESEAVIEEEVKAGPGRRDVRADETEVED